MRKGSHWAAMFLVLGCADGPGGPVVAPPTETGASQGPTAGGTGAGDTAVAAPTPTGTPPTATTADTGPFEPCGASVVQVAATAGAPGTGVSLAFTLDRPVPAVARCVPDDDPDHVVFGESTTAAHDHTVRLLGLRAGTAHTCTVAAACEGEALPPASVAYTTPRPPTGIGPFEVQVDPVLGATEGWTVAGLQGGGSGYAVIWDAEGRVRWWHALPLGVGIDVELLHSGGDLFTWGGGYSAEGRVRQVHLFDGEVYAFAPTGWEQTVFHHDAKALPDGRLLTLEQRENRKGPHVWTGFGIRAHDPVTGVVDLDLDSQRYVDEGWLAEPEPLDADPYHANWVDLSEDGSEVYVSLCFGQQLLALDAVDGALLWQLGPGLGWSVQDASGVELGDAALPQCQHGVDVLGGGRFLVYDNGVVRRTSSASEWLVDPVARTATRIWHWTETGWYEPFLGDVDRLSDDRTLVVEASLFDRADLVEVVRSTGAVAGRMTLTSGSLYRAERYDGCAFFDDATACGALADRHGRFEAALTP